MRWQIWRIEDFGRVELAPDEFGEFFSAETYIVVYRYMHNNKEANLVYFWQGSDSSTVG
jgi:hypothetical protein